MLKEKSASAECMPLYANEAIAYWKAQWNTQKAERDQLTTALAEAKELLREIRGNEVNASDEADKFLRDHVPSELSKAKARCAELENKMTTLLDATAGDMPKWKAEELNRKLASVEAQRDRMKAALEEHNKIWVFLESLQVSIPIKYQAGKPPKYIKLTREGIAALSTPPAEEKP
jgi:DNA repair exonuclease SbcCD ATPase subunit